MSRIAFKPGKRGPYMPWIKTRPTGGLCFTVGFHKLQAILQKSELITEHEKVIRVEVDRYGLTVFLDKGSEE